MTMPIRDHTRWAVLTLALALLLPTAANAQNAYITNDGSNTVSVIETASNSVTTTIPVGFEPFSVAVTPDGAKVYVANRSEGTVSVIATASGTVIATIPVGSSLEGVAVTPDSTKVYVTNGGGGSVSVIDTASNTVTTTIFAIGLDPTGVTVTPDGAKVYVTDSWNPGTVSVIDTAGNTVVKTIPVGPYPKGVAVTPDGAKAYVVNALGNSVSVIDTASDTVLATILPFGGSPFGVAVTPDGAKAYVTNQDSGTVSVIATASDTVLATIPVGSAPEGVAVTPDGAKVYVANVYGNTVSVIDTASNTVVKTIPVGTGPRAFGKFIGPAPAAPLPCNNSSQAEVCVLPLVNLAGEISIKELSGQPAINRPITSLGDKKPKHHLPRGGLTSEPSKAAIDALPRLAPNADVRLPIISVGFVGINSRDNVTANGRDIEPPDQGLAVNNNVVAEINNDVLRFFTTTGTALTLPIAVSKFFKASATMTDPQAFFDPTTGRWFFTVIESNNIPGSVENLDVAVSKTSDPLGSYFIYHVRAVSNDIRKCGGHDCFPDYPKAGYDANGLYISSNLDVAGCGTCFVAAATYALPKSLLEAGASFKPVRVVYQSDFVVQPSVPAPGEPFVTAANGTEYLMEAHNILDQSSNIRIWAISNTKNIVTAPMSLRAFYKDIPAETYGCAVPHCKGTVPAIQPNVIGPYCMSQGFTSAPSLDGGYWSFQATVQMATNGRLYGTLPSASVDGKGLPRDVLAWFVIKPSVNSTGIPSAFIVHQGYVVPVNGSSILNPAFGINKTGAGVLGFSITNTSRIVPGGFPSTAFIQFTGTRTTGSIMVSGPGVTSDDGFSGCGPGPRPDGVGRWGDYGAATVDAATGFFYTANENISGPQSTLTNIHQSNWGTFITKLH